MPKKKKTQWSWKRYPFKNLTLLAMSLFLSIFLLTNQTFHDDLHQLGSFGIFGAFIAGILFVSTFTAATGLVILIFLAETLPIYVVALMAGIGAVVGDITIFRFIRSEGILDELKLFWKFKKGGRINKLIHTRYFAWTLPVIGALLIASPLPDELGVGLVGISKMKTYQFLILSFSLNTLGIVVVLLASQIV